MTRITTLLNCIIAISLVSLLGCGVSEQISSVTSSGGLSTGGSSRSSVTVNLSVSTTNVTELSSRRTQLGDAIEGGASNDIGSVVSLSEDGSVMAIGSYQHDASIGTVQVYDLVSNTWVQRGLDIDGEAAGDLSGAAIDLSADGDTIVIGAMNNDGGGANAGHVRIFDWSGTAWIQRGLDIDGAAAGGLCGVSVSISNDGDVVAFGCHLAGALVEGKVRVYAWNGTAWAQRGADIEGEANFFYSGWSVALDSAGDTIVIGTPSLASNKVGRARVFEFNGTSWTQTANLNGSTINDSFGLSVGISDAGDRIIVGAPFDVTNLGAGYAKVFVLSGSTWTALGSPINAVSLGDLTGFSVAISGDGERVLVGAPKDGEGDRGVIRVYSFSNNAWNVQGETMEGTANTDQMGMFVDISGDGFTYGMGSIFHNSSAGEVKVIRDEILAPSVTITARLSQVVVGSVLVDLATIGTATGSGTDYSLSSSRITIPSGQLQSTIRLTSVEDTISDDGESVILYIDSITGGPVAGETAQVQVYIRE